MNSSPICTTCTICTNWSDFSPLEELGRTSHSSTKSRFVGRKSRFVGTKSGCPDLSATSALFSLQYLIRTFATLLFAYFLALPLHAEEDSVDVTFFYEPPGDPTGLEIRGEFNGWGANPLPMNHIGSGLWSKTVRLRVGGPIPLPNPGKSIQGAYQYKFWYPGVTNWPNDPLNPRQNPLDFNNSYVFTNSPTIHYLLPNEVSGLVESTQPQISAYIFPSTFWAIDTSSIAISIDGVIHEHLGNSYDPSTKKLSFIWPTPLENGTHTLKLEVENVIGSLTADSTTFYVQGGFVQILTLSNREHIRPTKLLEGSIEDSSISQVKILYNADSTIVSATDGRFSHLATLVEGDNVFRALVTDSLGFEQESSPVTITYVVDHSPQPTVEIVSDTAGVTLTALPNDPDSDAVTISWTSDDAVNPELLGVVASGSELTIPIPETPGEYYFDLAVIDASDNSGTARGYFILGEGGTIEIPTIDNNPGWVKDAIVYEIFVPAFSSSGNLDAITGRLEYLKDLGVNVIWLMPIYENGETINELNAGFNITDFFKVHPQLGTLQDFDELMDAAHELGLRVILDSTPNHVSGNHEWIDDIRLFRDFSNYRPLIETRILGDNRDLGQVAITESGQTLFVHYSNWWLANLNYDNIETGAFMLDMYKWWLLERDVDGYRMDVYWGPQNRYGQSAWWRPFREEVKRVKPDVFILGETDGTGIGSENNYADGGGASDAAYDWNLYGEIKSTLSGGSLGSLDNRVRNFSPTTFYNQFTGSNAHYFRFVENHDESRIASMYSTAQTRAAATLFLTAPGIPMLYAGQEVGETSRRGRINWNRTGGQEMFLFYQRLIAARNRFETFRSAEIVRLTSGHSRVYAYLRPFLDQNAIVAVNFSSLSATASLDVPESGLRLSEPLDSTETYYMNDIQNDSVFVIGTEELSAVSMTLPPWGSKVILFSDTLINLTITDVTEGPVTETLPTDFHLDQNYPNPFNPSTTISYELPVEADVKLVIYDILGRELTTLVDQIQRPGRYRVSWNGANRFGVSVSSGVYLYRLRAGDFLEVKKMILSK